MWLLKELLCLLLQMSFCFGHSTMTSLLSFIGGLGWKHVNIVSNQAIINRRLLKHSGPSKISMKIGPFDWNSCERKSDMPLIMITSQIEVAEQNVRCAGRRRPQLSLVLFCNNVTIIQLLSKDILNNLDETNSFYLSELGMDEKDGSVTVANSKFVFTSKHGGKVSLNDIEIKRNPESASWRIAPKFNLGGIEAKGISISWPPFYTVDDCDQNGQNCKNCHGILDALLKSVQELFNLTVTCDNEKSGDWGTVPKTGTWLDQNATFSGVLGGLIHGDYDVSTSSWGNLYSRHLWLESPFGVLETEYCLVLNLAKSPSDLMFPLRTFTANAWIVIALLFAFALCFGKLLLCMREKKIGIRDSESWLSLTIGILFVVISGYYGGLLTSYLIEKPGVPFKTWREGLERYPEWKYFTLKGTEGLFTQRVESKDPVFVNYLKIMQSSPDLTTPDMPSAMQRLSVPGTYFISSRASVVAAAKKDPDLDRKRLRLLGVKTLATSVLLRKHSPFKVFFDMAARQMVEFGSMESVLRKYVGELPTQEQNGPRVINLVEFSLPLIFMGASTILCLVLLMAENIDYKIKFKRETRIH